MDRRAPLPRPLEVPASTLAALALLPLLAGGCGLRHLARTVGAGATEVRASTGGPLMGNLGFSLPLPNIEVAGRHGLTDRLDVDAGVSLPALALAIGALDLGLIGQILRRPDGPAVSASARGLLVADLDDGHLRVYPELAVNAELPVGRRYVVFGGVTALAQLSPPPGKPPVFVAPHVGAEVRVGRASGLVVQAAWISPWEDSTSVVEWQPHAAGAFGVLVGWRTRLGAGGGVR